PESRVDRLGKRERLRRRTGDTTSLCRDRELDFFGVGSICYFGFPNRDMDGAFVGGFLNYPPGRGEFLAKEVHRRKNSLGKAFLVAVPLVAATNCENQQQEPEKRKPDFESSDRVQIGRQGQTLNISGLI